MSLLELFHISVSQYELYPEGDALVDQLLHGMASDRIIHISEYSATRWVQISAPRLFAVFSQSLMQNRSSLPAFTLVSYLAYLTTLKMEATCSSEISVDFQQTTRRYIPEARTLHNDLCENVRC
jgi:hypothetical protein